MNLRDRKRAQMKAERSESGFLGQYLAWLRNEGEDGPAASENLEADIADVFATPEGLRVLILFERAVLLSSVPDGSDDRALRESNAVRNFVFEIRRYAAHGRHRPKSRK